MCYYSLIIVNVPVCQSIVNSITLVSHDSGISACIFVPYLTVQVLLLVQSLVCTVGFQSQVRVNSVSSGTNGKLTRFDTAVQE
jgi:hypothetical protein